METHKPTRLLVSRRSRAQALVGVVLASACVMGGSPAHADGGRAARPGARRSHRLREMSGIAVAIFRHHSALILDSA
jgi:hypothetical protein